MQMPPISLKHSDSTFVSDVTSIDLEYLGSLVNTNTFDENTVDATIWQMAPDGMYCLFLIYCRNQYFNRQL
jgi:hypothetical protein